MERHRRHERAARALLSHADSALTRAAAHLAHGEPLQAMRTARVVETLMALDAALEAKRLEDDLRRAELKQRERDLASRAQAIEERAARIEDNARRVRDFCETMGLNHDAIAGR